MTTIDRDLLRSAGSELCRAVSEIHAHSWAPGTGGNFSVTVAREPLRLLITQTGRDKMLKGLEGIHDHQARVWVPILPNTQDMVGSSERVRELLATQPGLHGFLLAGHGLYTWCETLDQARRHVEIFEFLLEAAARRTPLEPFLG